MSSSRTESELQQVYLAAVAREYNFRKYPDTILVERIRQKYTVISDTEKLRKKLGELFAANKIREIEKTLPLYHDKLEEYDDIFRIEQKELDTIKSIIREVPILISMLDSAIKHLPKVNGDAPDTDKKIHKITLQELKSYLKEMKLLQAQRYKINLTVDEALGVNKKTKAIKNKLDKLMIAFEKKVEKFYDALSLMYKMARAKSRAKSRKKTKTKPTAKSKKKLNAKTEKKNKEKNVKTMIDMRVGVDDYVVFFRDTFTKLEKNFVKSKTHLQAMLPRANNAIAGKKITTTDGEILRRMMVNDAAISLQHRLKIIQADFEKVKQKGNAILSQSSELARSDVQFSIDVEQNLKAKTMLDESKYGTHLRTAVLNAVSDYINQQSVKDAALYDLYTPLAQIPALTEIDDITGIINETLANKQHLYDEKFIKILKNNLAHAFKTIPYKFEDVATNTNEIIFDPSKAQELVNVDSVAKVLNERSALLDKGAHIMEEYDKLIESYKKIYKAESQNAGLIRYRHDAIVIKFEKLKKSAAPYLYDNNINLLMGKINQELYLMQNPTHRPVDVDKRAIEAGALLKQLTSAIDAAAKEKPAKDDNANLEKLHETLYFLIDDTVSSNSELDKSSEEVLAVLKKRNLKTHYSTTVGEVSPSANLVALGEAARKSNVVGSHKTKGTTLFAKNKSSAVKHGHEFIELIRKLDKDFIKSSDNVTQLIDDIKEFQKAPSRKPTL